MIFMDCFNDVKGSMKVFCFVLFCLFLKWDREGREDGETKGPPCPDHGLELGVY